MKQYNTELTIGVDLGNKNHELFALESLTGKEVFREQIKNNIQTVEKYFKMFKSPSKVTVAMEVGTHSRWISQLLAKMGFEVLVGNARKIRAIWDTANKTDAKDAEMLARIARFDRKLLSPIKHRSEEAHKDLNIIKCRDGLVRARSSLVNSVRGMLKSHGIMVSKSSTPAFSKKVLEILPEDLHTIFIDILKTIDSITEKIKNFDAQIGKLCKEKYPEAVRLQQINGVGPVTSLAYVLTLEDHHRFVKSRDVGAYIGLVPKRDQSGSTDKQLRITKAGDKYLRRLLVGSAQYILGPLSKDSDLKVYGSKISARGGKIAKRKAVVAVARKLAVLMHSLWRSEEEYEPLRNNSRKKKKDIIKKAA